jgi:hypothetical protein
MTTTIMVSAVLVREEHAVTLLTYQVNCKRERNRPAHSIL